MAIRFLDNNYYKSPFVRGLKGPLKSLGCFLICECSPSGFWALDMEAASMYIGFTVTDKEFEDSFILNGKAISVGGSKFFFPDFIEHQYPSGLQSWNKAHNKIILELNKFGFLNEEKISRDVKGSKVDGILYFVKNEGALKGLTSPQGIGQGNSNSIGNSQSQGNVVINEKLLIPEMFTVFKKHLPKYPAFVDKDFKPLLSIANFIHDQTGLNGNVITNQKSIVEEWGKMCEVIAVDKFYKTKPLSTLSNSIQEIYQIAKHGNSIIGDSKKTLHTGNVPKGTFGKL